MTLTPEALDELVERLRSRANIWTAGSEEAAALDRQAASAIAALGKERDEVARDEVAAGKEILSLAIRTARDLERERCAMLAEMAGQMELAKQIRAEP